MKTIVSPCIHVCRINRETGKCVGCNRTTREIGLWSSMSDEERNAWMQRNCPDKLEELLK